MCNLDHHKRLGRGRECSLSCWIAEQTFEHFKTDKGVEMYRNLSSSLQILKGVGEIQAPVDAVKKVIDEDYKTWDDGLKQVT